MASVSKEFGRSYFLPDEIVVQILSKTDLKTICICKRVSRRFYRVVCQVDTISFNAPSSWKTHNSRFREHVYSLAVLKRPHKNNYRTRPAWRFDRLVDGLIDSMTKFTRLKSLYIKLPSSSFKDLPFLKWKVHIASNTIDSFVFLSPTSIHDAKGSSYVNGNADHEKEEEPYSRRYFQSDIARKCLKDVFVRYMMLFGFAHECPFMEKISITDSRKRGEVSLSGAKLSEVIKSFSAPPEADNFFHKVSGCRIPLLYLPVSGFVMKGVELMLYERIRADVDLPYGYSYDHYINIDDDKDDFEDKKEAAYSEAVMEIFKMHRDKMCHLGKGQL